MLTFTSLQAPNQDFIIAAVAEYLGARLGVETRFVNERPWQERELLLDQGEIDISWICGLPYVVKKGWASWPFELLAAPVMLGARYGQKPVYFSDVIVRRSSGWANFSELRGASWAYNEPGSQSGYGVTRYHLAALGENGSYFGRVVEAGSHEHALQMVLGGDIDAAAIDSTVLELEIKNNPQIMDQLQVVAIFGPSPIPPLIIAKSVPGAIKEKLKALLLTMHNDPEGEALLKSGLIARYVAVTDEDYDPIRAMARLAKDISLEPFE